MLETEQGNKPQTVSQCTSDTEMPEEKEGKGEKMSEPKGGSRENTYSNKADNRLQTEGNLRVGADGRNTSLTDFTVAI